MSLRDWFAGQALIAMASTGDYKFTDGGHLGAATDAYAIADAMLRARESKGG